MVSCLVIRGFSSLFQRKVFRFVLAKALFTAAFEASLLSYCGGVLIP